MKQKFLRYFAGLFLFFLSCGDSVLPAGYTVEFPAVPAHWRDVLGEPLWRLEWNGADGGTERAVVNARTGQPAPRLNLSADWPGFVLAFPFWPGLDPGHFRPAGAIFPFDASDGRIRLSWRGGVDAAFYRALEEAAAANSGAKPVRRPRYFDWPRFRVFMSQNAPADLRADPWLADWTAAAGKTVSSSFRASYVKAGERAPVAVSIPCDGPWLSASPFRQAEHWRAGDVMELFLGAEPETWVCPGGMFALSQTARLWAPR